VVQLLQRGVVQHRVAPFVVSVVITRPPDVVVNDRRECGGILARVEPVRAGRKDVRHTLVGVEPVLRRPFVKGNPNFTLCGN